MHPAIAIWAAVTLACVPHCKTRDILMPESDTDVLVDHGRPVETQIYLQNDLDTPTQQFSGIVNMQEIFLEDEGLVTYDRFMDDEEDKVISLINPSTPDLCVDDYKQFIKDALQSKNDIDHRSPNLPDIPTFSSNISSKDDENLDAFNFDFEDFENFIEEATQTLEKIDQQPKNIPDMEVNDFFNIAIEVDHRENMIDTEESTNYSIDGHGTWMKNSEEYIKDSYETLEKIDSQINKIYEEEVTDDISSDVDAIYIDEIYPEETTEYWIKNHKGSIKKMSQALKKIEQQFYNTFEVEANQLLNDKETIGSPHESWIGECDNFIQETLQALRKIDDQLDEMEIEVDNLLNLDNKIIASKESLISYTHESWLKYSDEFIIAAFQTLKDIEHQMEQILDEDALLPEDIENSLNEISISNDLEYSWIGDTERFFQDAVKSLEEIEYNQYAENSYKEENTFDLKTDNRDIIVDEAKFSSLSSQIDDFDLYLKETFQSLEKHQPKELSNQEELVAQRDSTKEDDVTSTMVDSWEEHCNPFINEYLEPLKSNEPHKQIFVDQQEKNVIDNLESWMKESKQFIEESLESLKLVDTGILKENVFAEGDVPKIYVDTVLAAKPPRSTDLEQFAEDSWRQLEAIERSLKNIQDKENLDISETNEELIISAENVDTDFEQFIEKSLQSFNTIENSLLFEGFSKENIADNVLGAEMSATGFSLTEFEPFIEKYWEDLKTIERAMQEIFENSATPRAEKVPTFAVETPEPDFSLTDFVDFIEESWKKLKSIEFSMPKNIDKENLEISETDVEENLPFDFNYFDHFIQKSSKTLEMIERNMQDIFDIDDLDGLGKDENPIIAANTPENDFIEFDQFIEKFWRDLKTLENVMMKLFNKDNLDMYESEKEPNIETPSFDISDFKQFIEQSYKNLRTIEQSIRKVFDKEMIVGEHEIETENVDTPASNFNVGEFEQFVKESWKNLKIIENSMEKENKIEDLSIPKAYAKTVGPLASDSSFISFEKFLKESSKHLKTIERIMQDVFNKEKLATSEADIENASALKSSTFDFKKQEQFIKESWKELKSIERKMQKGFNKKDEKGICTFDFTNYKQFIKKSWNQLKIIERIMQKQFPKRNKIVASKSPIFKVDEYKKFIRKTLKCLKYIEDFQRKFLKTAFKSKMTRHQVETESKYPKRPFIHQENIEKYKLQKIKNAQSKKPKYPCCPNALGLISTYKLMKNVFLFMIIMFLMRMSHQICQLESVVLTLKPQSEIMQRMLQKNLEELRRIRAPSCHNPVKGDDTQL